MAMSAIERYSQRSEERKKKKEKKRRIEGNKKDILLSSVMNKTRREFMRSKLCQLKQLLC